MNLREWIEDKIRENSWENRLNEESPYEANAISIAKPILKRLKNDENNNYDFVKFQKTKL